MVSLLYSQKGPKPTQSPWLSRSTIPWVSVRVSMCSCNLKMAELTLAGGDRKKEGRNQNLVMPLKLFLYQQSVIERQRERKGDREREREGERERADWLSGYFTLAQRQGFSKTTLGKRGLSTLEFLMSIFSSWNAWSELTQSTFFHI